MKLVKLTGLSQGLGRYTERLQSAAGCINDNLTMQALTYLDSLVLLQPPALPLEVRQTETLFMAPELINSRLIF